MKATSHAKDCRLDGTSSDGCCDERERGLASLWLLVLMPIMLMLGGLAIDIWRGYSEWRAMAEMAESGARAGANGIDLELFDLTSEVQLDPAQARALAIANLQSQSPNETQYVTFSGVRSDVETVTVEIRGVVPITLLGIVGVTDLNIAVSSEAEPRIRR
jgi:Flp pilus assembly protein TadG